MNRAEEVVKTFEKANAAKSGNPPDKRLNTGARHWA
jgi:hypothetical protein